MAAPRRSPLRYLGPFRSRPRLLACFASGLAVWGVLALVPSRLDGPTRGILGWDVGCIAYVATTLRHVARRGAPFIRDAAARQDEGQGIILGLVLATTLPWMSPRRSRRACSSPRISSRFTGVSLSSAECLKTRIVT